MNSIFPELPILVVDDGRTSLMAITSLLVNNGFGNAVACRDSRFVMDILKETPVEAVLLDLQMPHVSGESLLQKIRFEFPELPVIIVTMSNEVEKAVACMKNGAFDFFTKPVDRDRLTVSLVRAIELNRLKRENRELRHQLLSDEITNPGAFAHIVTRNRQMISSLKYAEIVAPSPEPVLITGETGVGKELLAKSIHVLSKRTGQMVTVNVAGIDDNMFSDTLFGHVRGAYTSADKDRSGQIETAEGGSLFLDEIGDLGTGSQVKLLRFLQEREYLPLGHDKQKTADVRILAATNRDLWNLQKQGKFRRDLIYRLDTHHIRIPPLRERIDDIPLLTNHFIAEAAGKLGRNAPTPPPELYALLKTHPFFGNVRELRSMVYNAVSRHKVGVLSMASFKERMKRSEDTGQAEKFGVDKIFALVDEFPTIPQATNALIKEAMKRAEGKQSIHRRQIARHFFGGP